jgi:hypothetical protein
LQVDHKRERSPKKPNYLSPTICSLAKSNLEAYPHVSETVQGSLHIDIPLSREEINEQYHLEELFFPKAPFEEEENPKK